MESASLVSRKRPPRLLPPPVRWPQRLHVDPAAAAAAAAAASEPRPSDRRRPRGGRGTESGSRERRGKKGEVHLTNTQTGRRKRGRGEERGKGVRKEKRRAGRKRPRKGGRIGRRRGAEDLPDRAEKRKKILFSSCQRTLFSSPWVQRGLPSSLPHRRGRRASCIDRSRRKEGRPLTSRLRTTAADDGGRKAVLSAAAAIKRGRSREKARMQASPPPPHTHTSRSPLNKGHTLKKGGARDTPRPGVALRFCFFNHTDEFLYAGNHH